MQLPLLRLGRRRRPLRRRRHHVNDAIAARLQLVQDPRQRRHRARLDVVQQQDALALGLEPLDREIVDPRRRDMRASRRPGNRRSRSGCPARPDSPRPRRRAAGPGMRKNGASCVASSPSAPFVEAMPSSISCLARSIGICCMVSGWFWLWVPMVWPASRELADAFRIGLGLRPMMKKVALTHCAARICQNLVAVCAAAGRHRRSAPLRDRASGSVSAYCMVPIRGCSRGIDHQRARGPERVGMAGAVGRGRHLADGAGPAPAGTRPIATASKLPNATLAITGCLPIQSDEVIATFRRTKFPLRGNVT